MDIESDTATYQNVETLHLRAQIIIIEINTYATVLSFEIETIAESRTCKRSKDKAVCYRNCIVNKDWNADIGFRVVDTTVFT